MLSHWDISHWKSWLLSLGKGTCNRVVLPNLRCLLSVSVVVADSSLPRILGESSTIHSPSVLFFPFSFQAEISLHTLIPFFRQESVHSGSAISDDCGLVFPDELRMSPFPDRFPTLCPDSGPLRLRWVKGVGVFRCNLPPALLAE